MAMELINGIPCFNCTDVERAKKIGLDGPNNVQDPLHPSPVIPANDAVASSAASVPSVNQPLASGDRGTRLNLLA